MLAAEVLPGQPPKILAAEREVTRLGASVFRDGRLSTQAMDETARVLARMAEVYRRLDVVGVRAVATSAVRDASNQAEFLERSSAASGYPYRNHHGPGRGTVDPPGCDEPMASSGQTCSGN